MIGQFHEINHNEMKLNLSWESENEFFNWIKAKLVSAWHNGIEGEEKEDKDEEQPSN